MHYFFGLQVLQTKEGISLSHSKYACDLLRRFHMGEFKVTTSEDQIINIKDKYLWYGFLLSWYRH